MTRQLPPLVGFAELVQTAVVSASQHVVDGSRRNAREALATRVDDDRASAEMLAALRVQASPGHRSA